MDIKNLLNEIEQVAHNNSYPIIGPEKADFLSGLIRERQPLRVLEIGTLVGYSAIAMASNLPEGGHIVTIEHNVTSARLAQRNIKKAGLEKKITVIVGKALKVLPELKGGFDFVFIDADKKEYLDYLRVVEGLVASGSLIVADNVGKFALDMEDFLSYVRIRPGFRCRNISFGEDSMELIEIIGKMC